MTAYDIKLLRKKIIARDTMAFYFQKPANFEFKAGQFSDFTLINPEETDEEGNTRAFSLGSAPFEDEIMIATRLRDTAFKRVLKSMPDGAEIKMDAPIGNFKLHNNESKEAIFLIGGVGITPVRSIVGQATSEKSAIKMTLLFSNRTPEDAPFIDDFNQWASINKNFTFVPTMTQSSESNWQGETGYISKDLILKYTKDLLNSIFYLSGPASMVSAMRKLLDEMSIDEDNIRTEEFSGY